jgi:hypothetical protein
MQYKVEFIDEGELAQQLEELLNKMSQEGWKPLHITPIKFAYPCLIVTFAKE